MSVSARVGRVGGNVTDVTLNPPTVAEAIKQIEFDPRQPFTPDSFEIRFGDGTNTATKVAPENFESTLVPNGGIVIAAAVIHRHGGHQPVKS